MADTSGISTVGFLVTKVSYLSATSVLHWCSAFTLEVCTSAATSIQLHWWLKSKAKDCAAQELPVSEQKRTSSMQHKTLCNKGVRLNNSLCTL